MNGSKVVGGFGNFEKSNFKQKSFLAPDQE
jgi:hypothetical protein